jgi:hypothetical protein
VYLFIGRVLGVAVGIVFVLAMAMAMKLPVAIASEDAPPKASHSVPAEVAAPIELSPSQKARCARTPAADAVHNHDCNLGKDLLGLMNGERRDKLWADKTETGLSQWIESLASKGITSRNVECRLSWCMVEVGSTEGHLPKMEVSDAYKWKLFETLFLSAPDVDDSNVSDMTIIFKRYCKSINEILDSESHVVPGFYTVGQKCS